MLARRVLQQQVRQVARPLRGGGHQEPADPNKYGKFLLPHVADSHKKVAYVRCPILPAHFSPLHPPSVPAGTPTPIAGHPVPASARPLVQGALASMHRANGALQHAWMLEHFVRVQTALPGSDDVRRR